MNGIDQSISPGIGGFLTFFLLACALWLLMRNMIGHLRKVDQREELAEAERQARDGRGEVREERVMSSRPSALAAEVPRHPRSEPDTDGRATPDA